MTTQPEKASVIRSVFNGYRRQFIPCSVTIGICGLSVIALIVLYKNTPSKSPHRDFMHELKYTFSPLETSPFTGCALSSDGKSSKYAFCKASVNGKVFVGTFDRFSCYLFNFTKPNIPTYKFIGANSRVLAWPRNRFRVIKEDDQPFQSCTLIPFHLAFPFQSSNESETLFYLGLAYSDQVNCESQRLPALVSPKTGNCYFIKLVGDQLSAEESQSCDVICESLNNMPYEEPWRADNQF